MLVAALAVYIVCDILLTPLARLETRPVAKVTTLGFVVLGLLFVGLALAIIAVVLTFLRSQRLPIVAIVAVSPFWCADEALLSRAVFAAECSLLWDSPEALFS